MSLQCRFSRLQQAIQAAVNRKQPGSFQITSKEETYMPLANLLHRQKQIKGELGYFGLGNWWLSTFSQEERKHIESEFKPINIGGDAPNLTQGDVSWTSGTAVQLIAALAGWFKKPADYHIAKRMLAKAEELIPQEKNVLDLHFAYQSMIQTHYRNRDNDPEALDLATRACENQIAMAPLAAKQFKKEYREDPLPAHVGYTQLTIIRDKQRNMSEAIRLAKQAKKQGWDGDWEQRIARYQAKQAKLVQKKTES